MVRASRFHLTYISYRFSSDPMTRSHLAALYDTPFEKNVLWIVEPYSVVEIEFVAQYVGQVDKLSRPSTLLSPF